MALTQLFKTTAHGGITFTGNTLGLSQLINELQPGQEHTIGAFINTGNTQLNDFPEGTTADYRYNGSAAELNLPLGANVLYAAVIWAGTMSSRFQNIEYAINNSVIFNTPGGNHIQVLTPNPEQGYIGRESETIQYYMRYLDVTHLVKAAGNGTYEVGAIPAILDPNTSSTLAKGFAGWTLAVAYEDSSQTLKDMIISVGGQIVNKDNPSADITISNFMTSSVAPVNAKIFISAGEGDAQVEGDEVRFASNVDGLTEEARLSGPRNLATNFFASQITNDQGELDSTGTFGDRNQTPGGPYMDGARQGYDIAAIDVSDRMQTKQSSAVLRVMTDEDSVLITAVGFQADAYSFDLELTKTANPMNIPLNGIITYSVQVSNPGVVNADNVIITDPLTDGLEFIPGSIKVNEVSVGYDSAIITTGVNIGILPPATDTQQPVTISFQARVVDTQGITQFNNTSYVDYHYSTGTGDLILGSVQSNEIIVTIIKPVITVVNSVTETEAVEGDIVNFKITVTNKSPFPIQNLVFEDKYPMQFQALGSAPGDTITRRMGNLAPNGVWNIPLMATVVNADYVTSINNNNLSLTYDAYGTTITEPFYIDGIIPIRHPKYEIVKTPEKEFIQDNLPQAVSYSINVINTGDIALATLTVTEGEPSWLQYTGTPASISSGYSASGSLKTGLSIAPALPAAQSVMITFDGTITDAQGDLPPYINTVTAQATCTVNENAKTLDEVISEPAAIDVVTPPLMIEQSANPGTTMQNDSVTFTITMLNAGNRKAQTISLKNPIPSNMTYTDNSAQFLSTDVVGTFSVEGSPVTALNITVNTLMPWQKSIFTFTAVSNADTEVLYESTAQGTYSFHLDQQEEVDIVNNYPVTSNNAKVQNILLDLELENEYIYETTLGSGEGEVVESVFENTPLLITARIWNFSATPIVNPTLTDVLPDGITRTSDVLKVMDPDGNPVAFTGDNIQTGIILTATIPQMDTNSKPYEVLIPVLVGRNTDAITINEFTFTYGTVTAISNRRILQVERPSLQMTLTSVQPYTRNKDDVDYEIVVKNTGSMVISNFKAAVTVSDGLSLNGNITVDDNVTTYTLDEITWSKININESCSIKYKLSASDEVVCPYINNAVVNAKAQLEYVPDMLISGSKELSVSCITDSVEITLNTDKPNAEVSDILTQTITVTNHSSFDLVNAVVIETVPSGTALLIDTVDPPGPLTGAGIDLGLIAVGASRSIEYQLSIDTNPGVPLVDNARVSYTYIPIPGEDLVNGTDSPEAAVSTQIKTPSIKASKSQDKENVTIQDILNYNVIIENDGDIDMTDITVTDQLPEGLLFTGTATVSKNAETTTVAGDLALGIKVTDSLLVDEEITVILPCQVTDLSDLPFVNAADVSALYVVNPVSGARTYSTRTGNVSANGYTVLINAYKAADKYTALAGEYVPYVIIFVNNGDVEVTDVTVYDQIPDGCTLVGTSTIIVRNETQQEVNELITDGVTLGTIAPNEEVLVIYRISIDTVPPTEYINDASYEYQYQVTPQAPVIKVTNQYIEPETILGVNNSVDMEITASPTSVEPGETVTFTVKAANTGNVGAREISLTNLVPDGLDYIPDSLRVNNEPYVTTDLKSGILLDGVGLNETTIITFAASPPATAQPAQLKTVVNADYVYLKGPQFDDMKGNSVTDPIQITVTTKQPDPPISSAIVVTKASSLSSAIVGQSMMFTVSVANTSAGSVPGVTLVDVLPQGMAIVPNSIYINNESSNADSLNGYYIGTMTAGETVTFRYQAMIQKVVTPSYTNTSLAMFNNNADISNRASVTVDLISLSAVKTVDRSQLFVNGELYYTLELINQGAVLLQRVRIMDYHSNDVRFVPNSLTLYGYDMPGDTIENLLIENLPQSTAISPYSAKITYTMRAQNPRGRIDSNTNIYYEAEGQDQGFWIQVN